MAALALAALAACASQASKDGSGDGFDPNGERRPSAQTLYSMSKIMVSRGKDAEAEAVLSKLVADHPTFMPAYADLSELYMRNARPDSAAEVLKVGIGAAPEDAVLLNNLGMCRLMQGRYEEALDHFTAAAAGVPKDARARANMAVALGMLGRLEESLSLYLQLVPEADAHFNLGVLCEARQDPDGAAREFAIAEAIRSKRSPAPAASAEATKKP
jgi:Flp pilus assembly protein TadD